MTTATRPDVRIAERAGFCYGVRLAIDKAKHAASILGGIGLEVGMPVRFPGIGPLARLAPATPPYSQPQGHHPDIAWASQPESLLSG